MILAIVDAPLSEKEFPMGFVAVDRDLGN